MKRDMETGVTAVEELSDHELVVRARGGDAPAFEVLFRRHYDRSYRLAYRMAGNEADAEDICQRAFVKVARGISRFRGDSSFSTWMYRIVMNSAADVLGKQKRTKDGEAEYTELKKLGASESADISERYALSQSIELALAKLPVKQRQAITLVVFEEMTHAEAAKILGCAEATVSWRVHAARKELKKHFSE